jgi:aspartate/methionine/tyrosine aminotransferase
MNPLFAGLPTSIFERMSILARERGAVNLGQGFPDFGWPEDVLERAATEIRSGWNQYPPMRGTPELRTAVAAHYRRHQDLDIAPDEVTVTAGATEALAASLLALITPGDEVVLIEPLYDAYLPLVRRAGGIPRFLRLEAPGWQLTEEALDAAFGPSTRLVVLNNPHNPAAVSFSAAELRRLAERCVRHDVIAICDEVWEHVVFDGRSHLPLMAMPGMRERTVKIGSAGKIFALTGWKVGWAIAEPKLADTIAKAHQYLTFVTPPNLQAAVAYGLGKDVGYFEASRAMFQRGRDRLAAGLRAAGYATLKTQATYFLTIDLAASGIASDDMSFCERAVREAGVAAIPMSAFYEAAPARHLVRLCFAKADETLDAGIERFAALLPLMRTARPG